jgi:chromosome segregation ATPase
MISLLPNEIHNLPNPQGSPPTPRSVCATIGDIDSFADYILVSSDLSRSNSNASVSNDRLQERLAKAMAKKTISRPESPAIRPSSATPSDYRDDATTKLTDDVERDEELTLGLAPLEEAPRMSVDASENVTQKPDNALLDVTAPTEPALVEEGLTKQADLRTHVVPGSDTVIPLTESNENSQIAPLQALLIDPERKSEDTHPRSSADESVTIAKLQAEINGYIERIDTLQSKLKYLSKEAATSAKEAAAAAQSGSLEKKILEKDEKIALLIEEGQNLSKLEMKYLAAIKKMRAQVLGESKERESIKHRADKAEGALRTMEDRARKAEAASKRAEQTLAASSTNTNDFEAIRRERDALHATIADMKSQLVRANSRAEAAESKAQSDQLEKERRKASDLQDDLTSAKVEREISEEKLRREIKDLKAALEREKEQARAMESEMLGEQATLESKLESFRVRAEEASSADHGHVQAKLLRQIETLQSQYSTASQNWQGIESTLLGRITSLEKERDEIAGREAELRKKLRDATLKAKNTDRELDTLQNKYMEMDKSAAEGSAEIHRLTRKTTQLETDVTTARQDLEEQKVNAERELQRRLDEERAKWTASLHIQRTESPGTSIRKNVSNGIGLDLNHLMSPIQYERGSSRRPSMMPFDSNTPPRQQSTASFRGLANGSIAETPSGITSMDADEYFANVPPTPLSASHHSHRGVNDLVSTSTVGAGPSVQLVERISANVRRLESEKAASKDELSRITGQRDEARQEVVNLMREVEEKRRIEERLKALEKDYGEVTQRHRTTLEMLGEKSEQVEELKADIVDVKQMYRQLADTMK